MERGAPRPRSPAVPSSWFWGRRGDFGGDPRWHRVGGAMGSWCAPPLTPFWVTGPLLWGGIWGRWHLGTLWGRGGCASCCWCHPGVPMGLVVRMWGRLWGTLPPPQAPPGRLTPKMVFWGQQDAWGWVRGALVGWGTWGAGGLSATGLEPPRGPGTPKGWGRCHGPCVRVTPKEESRGYERCPPIMMG